VAPEFEKLWHRFARRVGSSWRVDETYACIRGRWHCLYRAVDEQGMTVNFLLRQDRGVAAAQAFFRKALTTASITISGIERADRVHKQRGALGSGRRPRHWSLKQQWERALA
jgi:transposase-like protein